jgi:transposase InsO family protein
MNRRKRTIDPQVEQRIIDLRKKYIRYGKEKLAVIYEKTYGEKISCWQIQRTIKDKQLYWLPSEAAKQRRRRFLGQKKKRITQLVRTEPKGFFFQLDTKHIFWNGERFYIFTACEKNYKIGFANAYAGMSSMKATDFLARLLYLVDGKVELLQTDNGPEFAKYFEKACQNLNITRYYSRVKTPTDNESVERFNRTFWEEFVERGNFTHFMDEFNRRLAQWLIEYNFNRPHRSLGMLSPMEFLKKCQGVSPLTPSHTRT